MSNDSNTTQRDELARDIRVADVAAARDISSNEYEAMADAVLAKYILIPRPTFGEAHRGSSHVILVDGAGVTDNATWLRTALAAEELAMESCAYRTEHLRAALAYLDTEKAAQAEKKLQERRDALASELSMGAYSYERLYPMLQNATNRIIELEDTAEATR